MAVATFSSITVVPGAVAADDTTFVEEKTTDETVSLNGIEFDEDGNLLEESNAAIRRWKNSTRKNTPPSPSPRTP